MKEADTSGGDNTGGDGGDDGDGGSGIDDGSGDNDGDDGNNYTAAELREAIAEKKMKFLKPNKIFMKRRLTTMKQSRSR